MTILNANRVTREIASNLVKSCSFELTPKQVHRIPKIAARMQKGTELSVTCLTGAVQKDTIDACIALRAAQMKPIPHVAARSFVSRDHLREFLDELTTPLRNGGAEVDTIVLIAGGNTRPLGPFSDTMQVLETGLLEEFGIKKVVFAGHPQGNPLVEDHVTLDFLLQKNKWIEENPHIRGEILTQFCFCAPTIVDWTKKLRDEGNKLPVCVGVTGPTQLSTLFRYAQWAGVTASAQQLSTRPMDLLRVASSAPEVLLLDVVSELTKETGMLDRSLVSSVHFYTFGGVSKTVKWAKGFQHELDSSLD